MKENNLRKNLNAINFKKFAALLISSVFIISMLSMLSLPTTQAASSTFGNTNVGSIWNTFHGTKDGTRFQLSQSGTIQSISVYFANSGFNAKAAIYSDSGGNPSQLIAQSSSQSVNSIGWQTFTVPQTSLSPGYYWLSTSTSNYWASGVMSMNGASNSHIWVSSTFASDFSSSFGWATGSDSGVPSIYATYTPTTTSSTFGNTNVGSIWNTFHGTKDGTRFQLSQSGTIQSISVYFANSGFNAKAAIYSDSGGNPSQLIAQSSSQSVNSIGWQTFTVPQTSLSSGYYWLSTSTSNYWASGVMSMNGASNSHIWVSSTFASDFSSSFGWATGSDSGVPSIYATYTPTTTSSTFGNTNVGSIWNTFHGTKDGTRFQLSQSGTIQSISVYFANSGFNAKAAIYSDSGGNPSQLIAQSSSQSVNSIGWQTFTVPQTSLSSGYYWLSTSTSNYWASGVMSMNGASNSHIWVSSTFASDFSSSFGWATGSDSGVPSIYATYTPTTTTTTTYTLPNKPSVNLAPIPNGWSTATNNMWLSCGGVANVILDYNILYAGAPTIRLDPVGSTNNYAREVDGPAFGIKPGDTITFSCWIKISASSYGDKNPSNGARIGIDFYANNQPITGTTSSDGSVWTPSSGWASNQINVPWGTSTWTKVSIHFVVPSAYPAMGGYAGNSYYSGQMVTPTAMIPWMQVQGPYDGGQAWFADPQIYINT